MKRTNLLIIISAILLLTGCGNVNEGKDNDNVKQVAQTVDIVENGEQFDENSTDTGQPDENTTDSEQTDDITTDSEQTERRNAREFYVTEKGDGYILMETGDSNYTQRWDYRFEDGNFYYDFTTTNNTPDIQYVENDESPYMTVSINNTVEHLPVLIPLYLGIAKLESRESIERNKEGVLILDYFKELAEEPEDGSLNVWNSDGDNEVWLTIDGNFDIFEDDVDCEISNTYTYPRRGLSTDFMVCFTFDKDGNLKI